MIKKNIFLFFILLINNFSVFSMKRSHDESYAPFNDTEMIVDSFVELSLEDAGETAEKIITTRFGQILIEIKHSPSPRDIEEVISIDIADLIQTIDNLKFPELIKQIRFVQQEILNILMFDIPLECIKEKINECFIKLQEQCAMYLAKSIPRGGIVCPHPQRLVIFPDYWFNDPK